MSAIAFIVRPVRPRVPLETGCSLAMITSIMKNAICYHAMNRPARLHRNLTALAGADPYGLAYIADKYLPVAYLAGHRRALDRGNDLIQHGIRDYRLYPHLRHEGELVFRASV